ncbi:DUF4013 domain-containing protein [Haloarchaeobius sp. DYHT-AS-18]|uniref:DUF4013 domain-containing protein n=1 Tax=Haloarchaeobius sp. DYHT-AS-18 TaxID=3446117 RepID=UPI003EBB0811
MLLDTFRYPFRGPDARSVWAALAGFGLTASLLARFAVGLYPSALSLIPALLAVAPLVLWAGYCHRLVATTIEGATELPPARSLRGLARDGVRTAAVTGIYLSVPTAVLLVTVRGAGSLSPADVSGVGGAVFVLGTTVTLCLALAIVYLYPGALAALADGEPLVTALDPRGRGYVYRDSAYFLTWVVAFTVGTLGATLFGVVLAGRGVGGLLALAVTVYTSQVAARLVGVGYGRVVR